RPEAHARKQPEILESHCLPPKLNCKGYDIFDCMPTTVGRRDAELRRVRRTPRLSRIHKSRRRGQDGAAGTIPPPAKRRGGWRGAEAKRRRRPGWGALDRALN